MADDKEELAKAAAAPGSSDRPTMEIKVYSPFEIFFEGPAYSISAENETGPFDILPHHHNFITLVSACHVKITAPEEDKELDIDGGLMHIKADKLVLFLNV